MPCREQQPDPLIARPRPEGGYEIISGHRRQHAAQLAGLDTLPVIVRQMDDDAAILLMVDSNLQRESILPSERAFAYKMKLEAMKRTSGRPSKENVSQIGTQKRSDQIMAEELGESRNQIQRFIRLTNLIPELLDMVDQQPHRKSGTEDSGSGSRRGQRNGAHCQGHTGTIGCAAAAVCHIHPEPGCAVRSRCYL